MDKLDPYKIICEAIDIHPNIDMLIVKPYLYAYANKDDIERIKTDGLQSGEDKVIHAFFVRVPTYNDKFKDFLSDKVVLRINFSRLEKVKDQDVKIYFIRKKKITDDEVSEEDVEKLSQEVEDFTKLYLKYDDLHDVPHVAIKLDDGVLPAFTFKVIDGDD